MTDTKTLILFCAAVLLSALLPHPAQADYKGHHAPGGWGLQSGSQMPPGSVTVAPFYSRYHAGRLSDSTGEPVNVSGSNQDISVNALGAYGWWVTEHTLLGATWGAFAQVMVMDNSLEFADFDFSSSFGFGDIFVQPLNLGWHREQVDFMATYGIYLPVGRYDVDADDNTGMGMWTHEFGLGTTLFFDPERTWHLSAMGYLEIHSGKEDTDIQVGNILTLEGGLGRSWMEGAWSAGIAYYAQWKLSGDTIGGLDSIDPSLPAELTLNRSRLFGLGPEINIPIIRGEKLISIITARYQWEFGTRSTLEGQTFNLFVNFPFF